MPNIAVPEPGWTLGAAAESISINSKAPGTPNIAPGTKQLMRLSFAEGQLLEDLIKSGDFKVSFGKTIVSRAVKPHRRAVFVNKGCIDILVW